MRPTSHRYRVRRVCGRPRANAAEHGVDVQNSNIERMNAAPTQSPTNAESAIIEGPSIHTKASTAAVRPPETEGHVLTAGRCC